MNAMRFVDTNVLLYSISTVPNEAAKAMQAQSLMTCQDIVISVQVLQEFYVQATRPNRSNALTHEEITIAIVEDALSIKARYQLSYWDAAIIAAARAMNCQEVLSEDMNHGQEYGGVKVTNPFKN